MTQSLANVKLFLKYESFRICLPKCLLLLGEEAGGSSTFLYALTQVLN